MSYRDLIKVILMNMKNPELLNKHQKFGVFKLKYFYDYLTKIIFFISTKLPATIR